MSRKLSEAIQTELLDLTTEIDAVGPLVDKLHAVRPDEVEIRAIAATLHAFYNGIERVFLLVAKSFGETVGESHAWHRNLLADMASATESRAAVIDEALRDKLADYLGFRHFFRHAYPMRLKWELVRPLVHDLREVHRSLEGQIHAFLSELDDESVSRNGNATEAP